MTQTKFIKKGILHKKKQDYNSVGLNIGMMTLFNRSVQVW